VCVADVCQEGHRRGTALTHVIVGIALGVKSESSCAENTARPTTRLLHIDVGGTTREVLFSMEEEVDDLSSKHVSDLES
jgi:hypothetical protein